MKSDLAIMIDGIKLNIRVGIIFKYHDTVLIEVPRKDGGNSVIPGGRVKIDESCIDAIKREIKEEMNFDLKTGKITFLKHIESFFTFDDIRFHEFFFVYKYDVDEEDYMILKTIEENQDNHKTDYVFCQYDEFDKYNLLPLDVRDIIKE